MTKGEKRLLSLLIALCATMACVICVFLTMNGISTIDAEIARYEKALSSAPEADKTLSELSATIADATGESGADGREERVVSSSDAVAYVKGILFKEGMHPGRYALSDSGDGDFLDVSLRARPSSFFRFLSRGSFRAKGIRFTRISMNAARDSAEYDISFRVAYDIEK